MTYLESTYFYELEHSLVEDLISEFQNKGLTDKEKAIGLYLKVRDGWLYNPYLIAFRKEKYRVSHLLSKKEGHCIDKSIILIAGLRAMGIPARIHLAKVKNHIAVERLVEKFGTNELTPHGMVDVFINEKWVKASPAFNATLCAKCQVEPLEFNGEEDSVFQEYNHNGQAFMEYIEDYGHFDDMPLEFIINNMKTHYPQLAAIYMNQEKAVF
jgi:transglutaminase-like putative cysteine protease